MRIFYPLVDVSIRLTPLLGLALNACSKIYIHFVLLFCFKIRIYCRFTMNMGEIIKFYWIMWRPHNGDPKGITLLKSKKKQILEKRRGLKVTHTYKNLQLSAFGCRFV